jgi:apolipoprotein N-acyltransferase
MESIMLLKRQKIFWSLMVSVLSVIIYTSAFPPFDVGLSAYFFAIPFSLLFMSAKRPGFRTAIVCFMTSGFFSWFILIFWLRHVTWVGTLILSMILSVFFAAWFLVAWKMLPGLLEQSTKWRIVGMSSLAGWWVVIEYLRSIIFTGFPWLPLAASQWNQPTTLQLLAYTGSYGVSFVFIFFNLGLTFYLKKLISFQSGHWWQRICPEFYCSLALLMACFSLTLPTHYLKQDRETIFKAGIIQPYIPQSAKWDAEYGEEIYSILSTYTQYAATLGSDVIFWPEAATPYPIKQDDQIDPRLIELVKQVDVPILMGSLAVEQKNWFNIICALTPQDEFILPYYSKRHLVPFGEYIPLHSLFSFLEKFVPIGQFSAGKTLNLIPLVTKEQTYKIGPLICYEDTFPGLARDNVKAGADLHFVATNNAWYGEGASAYQHASHSVLRAIETRRPVIRCGNGGWSGWIDEYGRKQNVLTQPDKGVYFRGLETIDVKRDKNWVERQSFYVRHGDWFIVLCVLFILAGTRLFLARDVRAENESNLFKT